MLFFKKGLTVHFCSSALNACLFTFVIKIDYWLKICIWLFPTPSSYTRNPSPISTTDFSLTQNPLCPLTGVSSRFPDIMAAGTHSPGGPNGIIRSQSFAGFSTLQERRSR